MPGGMQSMGSQRVGHDSVTEQQHFTRGWGRKRGCVQNQCFLL